MTEDERTISFEFIKSNFFRVVHADGAFGGTSPRGDLCITFYSERFPIPRVMVHRMQGSGELGEEIRGEREERAGIIREAEVSVMMDLHAAKTLVSWLNGKVSELEKTLHPSSRIQPDGEEKS